MRRTPSREGRGENSVQRRHGFNQQTPEPQGKGLRTACRRHPQSPRPSTQKPNTWSGSFTSDPHCFPLRL